jgi:hypothetical protein
MASRSPDDLRKFIRTSLTAGKSKAYVIDALTNRLMNQGVDLYSAEDRAKKYLKTFLDEPRAIPGE